VINASEQARRSLDVAELPDRPVYVDPPPAIPVADQTWRMDQHERLRMRAAAFRATRLYPGPVGELISHELLAWEEFGYRLAANGSILRLVDDIMKTALEPTR
jgi:hypothetical protein